jgi:5'/3'-nucleotidase
MARRVTPLTALLLLVATIALGANPSPLRVLVTNDDGVAAPGIDALVNALVANPNLQVTVIGPLNNSSGTGEQVTLNAPIAVTETTTASGYPATAVAAFPGDTSLWGLRYALASTPPDIVVSGVNQGQNLSGEIVPLSGTVGAATWAARLGFPAIAVSAGLAGSPNYAQAAAYAAKVVEAFRTRATFRNKMLERDGTGRGVILNVNFPTCTTGSVRGVRVVGVGRATKVNTYSLLSDDGTTQTFQASNSSTNVLASNCTSTAPAGETDVDTFTIGFATVSPLVADRSINGRRLQEFALLEKLFP